MPSKTERLAANPANCVDLWGLTASDQKTTSINGKTYLTVNANDNQGFQNAADEYFGSLKYGTAGNIKVDGIALTNSDGSVLHAFSNDEAIEKYLDYVTQNNGNLAETAGNISTVTGIAGDLLKSSVLGGISTVTGVYKTGADFITFVDDPSVSSAAELVIDGIGFMGVPGTVASAALSESKEAVEEIKAIETEYQEKELLNQFIPPTERKEDYGHIFINCLKQAFGSIFGGKE